MTPHPADLINDAYARIRCIQELLAHVQHGRELTLGPDAAHGLYLSLESVAEILAVLRPIVENT